METTATREHPILFRPELVRKILDGAKTQTRRPVKPQPSVTDGDGAHWRDSKADLWRNESQYVRDCCPFGQVGDVLWVRERWAIEKRMLYFAADETCVSGDFFSTAPDLLELMGAADEAIPKPYTTPPPKWRPSIHMPRWACRLRLEITDVRVERIQSISAKDIMAEGVVDRAHHSEHFGKCPVSTIDKACYMDLQSLWAAAWEKAYKGSWQRNDWVWVITFKKLESR